MSIGRMRRSSRIVAVILLLTAVRGLPHFAQDDPSCAQAELAGGVRHDGSGQGLRPDSGLAPGDGHCAVCHFIRSLRSPFVAVDTGVLQAAPPVMASVPPAPGVSAPVLDHLPARAPPSASA